ncbi:hypothetical protein ACF064_02355 [Streptomyces sp. NPDC015492]|uniref:hypothetical protein n=1 Tax=Streptomyces sp. NPDC015492 TaxID=3364958 RepID=UPI0036FC0ACA
MRERAAGKLALYERIPSYRRAIEASGATGAAEIAVIGDEEAVAAEVRRYREAGATEVVTATELDGEEGRVRTWRLLGELSRG